MFRVLLGAAVSLLLVSGGFFLFAALADDAAAGSVSIITLGGLFLASVATFTGVYFGWRRDRREARKFQLEIEKLEAERSSGKLPDQ